MEVNGTNKYYTLTNTQPSYSNEPILNGVGRWDVMTDGYVDRTLGRIGQ